jgi:dTDP-4-amino-4,6-dideoxygalactose transaminase
MSVPHQTLALTKTRVSDLAIFGGPSAFSNSLHVGCPNIGDRTRFAERVRDIFDRRWLTNDGQYVTEFEQRVAELVGVRHCVATCNGTVALEIAIRALELKGEVILPSFTFIGTAHALEWQGIRPVFCDIAPGTHTIDPKHVEQLMTPRTTGILAVNLWGRACAIDALTEIAHAHRLRLLFDSAHALGCSYKRRTIGSFGDCEVLSFHATKFVNSLEGGAIVTNSDELATRARLMKNFGFTSYDQTASIGINAKMNEVSAAMGLTNLESANEFVAINHKHHEQYLDELEDLKGIRLLTYDNKEKTNYQYVVLEVDEHKTPLKRDELIQILHAENVLARRYFYPGCHRMEPYKSIYSGEVASLPETERVAASVIALPTGQAISEEDISGVCMIIRTAIENAPEVQKLLAETALPQPGMQSVPRAAHCL